jgi:pilus assembly protein TadC
LLESKTIEAQKLKMRKFLRMEHTKKKEKKLNYYRRLKLKLYKAGIEKEPEVYVRNVMFLAIVFASIMVFAYAIWAFISNPEYLVIIIISLAIFWILLFFILNYLFLLISHAFLSYRAFSRTKEVEKVLPEFLRLVATNYRSGLPLDKALIASNRARFGILSKEIEQVAKSTKVKGDLAKSLEIFGKKFDSKILERAMNSISNSTKTGSNISKLLDDIANNITKMRNMQASMAANVKNYVIFIVIAGIIIAPVMFAMSYHMNLTISEVKGRLEGQIGAGAATTTAPPITVTEGGGVRPSNFDFFAILMILTNCLISGMIISMIKQGNFQQGFKNVFLYAFISLSLYFLGKLILSGILSVV